MQRTSLELLSSKELSDGIDGYSAELSSLSSKPLDATSLFKAAKHEATLSCNFMYFNVLRKQHRLHSTAYEP